VCVSVHVDVDFVVHEVRQPVKIWSVGRLLQRNEVGEERDVLVAPRLVADKRVDVRVIGGGVLRNKRRIAVTGGFDQRPVGQRSHEQAGHASQYGEPRQTMMT